ncbi:MAG: 4-hydroxythreonine-4-phosphate dehydrogenase PdxA [Enterocloster clostridioformis]
MLDVIRIGDRACREMGIENPRIAVAGLNPTAGSTACSGREEIREIIPAIEAAEQEESRPRALCPRIPCSSKARGGWYDIVVAMYHDQGHIPLKVVGFVYNQERQAWDAVAGVNITLGLPVIRVSVDHGTAFDQAGTGTASELSLKNSLEYAVMFARNRK